MKHFFQLIYPLSATLITGKGATCNQEPLSSLGNFFSQYYVTTISSIFSIFLAYNEDDFDAKKRYKFTTPTSLQKVDFLFSIYGLFIEQLFDFFGC